MPTEALLVFFASVLPAIVWVWYFYRQDRFQREPLGLILRLFVGGMLAVVPAALYEYPFRTLLFQPGDLLTRALLALLVIGLGEEGAKWIALRLVTRRSDAFDEPIDGIVYGVTVALGFAAVENLLYILSFGLAVAPVRAIVASLAHASFSGLMGYYLGMAHTLPLPAATARGLLVRGFAEAVGLHAAYDVLITAGIASPWLVLLMVYALYRYLVAKMRAAQQRSPFRQE